MLGGRRDSHPTWRRYGHRGPSRKVCGQSASANRDTPVTPALSGSRGTGGLSWPIWSASPRAQSVSTARAGGPAKSPRGALRSHCHARKPKRPVRFGPPSVRGPLSRPGVRPAASHSPSRAAWRRRAWGAVALAKALRVAEKRQAAAGRKAGGRRGPIMRRTKPRCYPDSPSYPAVRRCVPRPRPGSGAAQETCSLRHNALLSPGHAFALGASSVRAPPLETGPAHPNNSLSPTRAALTRGWQQGVPMSLRRSPAGLLTPSVP
jgi:hypothetical protein